MVVTTKTEHYKGSGTTSTTSVDLGAVPPLEDGDQLVIEGNDKKVIRDGKVIWHSPGSIWITCA